MFKKICFISIIITFTSKNVINFQNTLTIRISCFKNYKVINIFRLCNTYAITVHKPTHHNVSANSIS